MTLSVKLSWNFAYLRASHKRCVQINLQPTCLQLKFFPTEAYFHAEMHRTLHRIADISELLRTQCQHCIPGHDVTREPVTTSQWQWIDIPPQLIQAAEISTQPFLPPTRINIRCYMGKVNMFGEYTLFKVNRTSNFCVFIVLPIHSFFL